MLILIRKLSWEDMSTGLIQPDVGRVESIARQCIAAIRVSDKHLDQKRDQLESSLDNALIAEFGIWIAGWNWAASEPGGGGPVHEYCCSRHSLLKGADPYEASVTRVIAAVRDWQAFLTDLDGRFKALHDRFALLPLDKGVGLCARELLPFVLERTRAADAWYATFSIVLTWFLESIGYERETIRNEVAEVVSGNFESWIEPSEDTITSTLDSVVERIDQSVESHVQEIDALIRWQRFRTWKIKQFQETRRTPVTADVHEAYIAQWDQVKSAGRASGMRRALAACREAAFAQRDLSLELLMEWQQHVLSESREKLLRNGPAFAKGGRERYGWKSSTLDRFKACLKESNDKSVDPTIRAARVYLDLCFFHPFVDGNGRAARLALDFVLTRAGLGLHACAPLFSISKWVTDNHDSYCFWLVVDQMAGLLSSQDS